MARQGLFDSSRLKRKRETFEKVRELRTTRASSSQRRALESTLRVMEGELKKKG